ncbi:hypothetical protein CTEN210_11967 [Chaetoceros tenuissimus]|uniref:Uncharacterized protein n=1 Tax=Chaetoceros tenuissimus TaxID=426638 RepID=A0AAD3D2A6_9STRA|nr:hypothetical protein CTEN210_11967 [Chaetoceros tenuissimus]
MKLLTLKLVLTAIFYVKVTYAEVRTFMHRRLRYHPPFELYTSEYLIHPGQIDLSEIRIIQLPDHPTWKHIKETSFAGVKILFFKQPATCEKAKSSCDWTEIGIGIKDDGGNIHYCCDEEEINLGLCQKERNGTLIIDQSLYHGEIRSAIQSNKFYEQASIRSPILSTYAGTGTYNLLLSDCNKNDSNLSFFKKYVWKRKDGYLPGYLFFEWHFLKLFYVHDLVFDTYGEQ